MSSLSECRLGSPWKSCCEGHWHRWAPHIPAQDTSHNPAAELSVFLAAMGKQKERIWSINSAPAALLWPQHAEMNVGRIWSSSGVLGMPPQHAVGLGACSLALLLLNYALLSFLRCFSMAKEDKSVAMQWMHAAGIKKSHMVQTCEGGKCEKPGLSELTVVF